MITAVLVLAATMVATNRLGSLGCFLIVLLTLPLQLLLFLLLLLLLPHGFTALNPATELSSYSTLTISNCFAVSAFAFRLVKPCAEIGVHHAALPAMALMAAKVHLLMHRGACFHVSACFNLF